MKFYTGLPVVSWFDELKNTHITTMFAPLVKTDRAVLHTAQGLGRVLKIEYWERCNKTVALVECATAKKRFVYWTCQGFEYDFEYLPHITLCDGDKTAEMEHLINQSFLTGPEYLRIF